MFGGVGAVWDHVENVSSAVWWIDSFCINQGSRQEKKDQIPKIANVYRNAGRVCIWLGSADAEGRTDRAMDFVKTIVAEHDVERLIDSARVSDWRDLVYLMRKSWFSRRWVIQELALAKDAIVRCGEKEAHWRDFADAIGLFNLHFERIRQLFRDDKKIPSAEYRTITDLNPLGAKILVNEISNAFLKDADGLLFEPLKGLETLISTLATFDTSDPRDTVHALLNIAKETSPFGSSKPEDPYNLLPKPSYTESLLETYINFLRWVIGHSESLDILCRAWALPARKEVSADTYEIRDILPSWIKVVPDSTHGKQTEGFNGRKNGDSFVGVPGARCYNASYGYKAGEIEFGKCVGAKCGDTKEKAQYSPYNTSKVRSGGKRKRGQVIDTPSKRRIKSSTATTGTPTSSHQTSPVLSAPPLKKPEEYCYISVTGLILDTVTWATDPIPDGVIPERGLERLGWRRTGVEEFREVPDKVWRTLVADRGLDGKNPPSWYHRACLRCLVKYSSNGNINTKSLLNDEYDNEPFPKIIADYLKRVQAVTWNRVILEANLNQDEKGLIGIGPPKTEVGDVVCILFGCSVPCILRPHNQGEYYEFIGEAFIYGKMDGEAITSLSKEERDVKTQRFRLF